MKRSAHSVYYDTSVEPYLHYEGPRDLAGYSEAALDIDALPLDDMVLLKHFRELARFAEDLVATTYELLDEQEAWAQELSEQTPMVRAVMEAEKRREFQAQQQQAGDGDDPTSATADINLPAILGMAWYWHKLVRQRKKEMTGLYAHALFLSWTSYCKLYHLYVVTGDASTHKKTYAQLQEMTADQFVYCQFASQDTNAVVSNTRVMTYTISEVWNAVRRIVPSLYQHSFHAEMKTYLHALFFRYCDLFCSAYSGDDGCGQNELARVLDHPLFYEKKLITEEEEEGGGSATVVDPHEHYDSYRAISVRVGPEHVLSSEYFYEGELLFFFQLARLRLSEQLREQYEANPIILQCPVDTSGDQLKKTNTSILQMFSELVVNPYIKKYIIEEFKRSVMSIYLYHGERERFCRRNPTAASDPNDVLTVCRPNDHMTAVAMQKATLRDILAKPGEFEREVVLIAKHVTHQWFKLGELKQQERVNQCFVIEELLPVEQLEQLVIDNELEKTEVPVLLKLVNVYYVLYKGGVYKSTRFVDSYLVWHALLVRCGQLVTGSGASSKPFSEKDCHQRIREELAYFVPL